MLNEKMYGLGSKRSSIREIFEYAKRRAVEIGAENVFDFSIGNPSVAAPECVHGTLEQLLKDTPSVALHGYTSAQGDASVRKTIADNYARRFGVPLAADDLYMTCGAAASLTITLNALYEDGDEVVVIAPYFAEYKVFTEGAGAKLVVAPSDEKTMLPDFTALAKAITPHTKAVIINSPNNPSGVVYGEKTLQTLASLLKEKSAEYQKRIFLVSDEPYRELVYNGETPLSPMLYYDDTIVCYSYSKSLSLPGERIGYIAVCPTMSDKQRVYLAVCGAGRTLGFVCAPALFQRLVAACDGMTADLRVYKRNRDLLYNALTEYGFTCVYPEGAFYLFMKTPTADAKVFCEQAKQYELLFVPGDSFGCEGWVRIAYCVQTERIERALPLFQKLAEEYAL